MVRISPNQQFTIASSLTTLLSLSLSVSLSLLTPASYLCIPFALLYKFPSILFSTCCLNKLLRGINRADGCHGHF